VTIGPVTRIATAASSRWSSPAAIARNVVVLFAQPAVTRWSALPVSVLTGPVTTIATPAVTRWFASVAFGTVIGITEDAIWLRAVYSPEIETRAVYNPEVMLAATYAPQIMLAAKE
jgi:hypothetical protein